MAIYRNNHIEQMLHDYRRRGETQQAARDRFYEKNPKLVEPLIALGTWTNETEHEIELEE